MRPPIRTNYSGLLLSDLPRKSSPHGVARKFQVSRQIQRHVRNCGYSRMHWASKAMLEGHAVQSSNEGERPCIWRCLLL